MKSEVLYWHLLGLAVKNIPAIAAVLHEALANDELEESVAEKVREILPARGESGELADKLRFLHMGE
jgi:hypothetical protein